MVVADTLNPSTREVEPGIEISRQGNKDKAGEDRGSPLCPSEPVSLWTYEDRTYSVWPEESAG